MVIMAVTSLIQETLEKGKGIMYLIPVFVPRRLSKAGFRLKLHPDDYQVPILEHVHTRQYICRMKWKSIAILLFVIGGFYGRSCLCCQEPSSPIVWKGNDKDDGSVHALGNGKMLVYESGANIFWIGSSPYSTPSIFSLAFVDSSQIVTASTREQGTAIWTHRVFRSGRTVGTFVDFVDSELPSMVRQFDLIEPLYFHLKLKDYVEIIDEPDNEGAEKHDSTILFRVPAGTRFYGKYPYPRPIYHQISWKGNAHVERIGEKNEYLITVLRGESELYFTGGPEYPQTIESGEEVRALAYTRLLERTRKWWKEFTAGRTDFELLLPADLPLRQKLLQTIDDVSVMIRTQQGKEGAVMAGYRYPLGYVRDQYGVSRALLALGYHNEARQIMDYYWNIWQKYGKIHNAQGIGIDGVFHVHENDEVEITGYILLQAFNWLEKSHDDQYIDMIFPLLEWCWEVQKKHLVRGMLPFNGDETYVAGGFLPRSALNDGSAEATMLFIDGGEKFLDWMKEHNKWATEKLETEEQILLHTRNLFRSNFWQDGHLIANNFERVMLTKIPRFRHGVCERAGPDCLFINSKGSSGVVWTERDANNRYQCPACLTLGPLPEREPASYNLISVSLIPYFIRSTLFEVQELKPVVQMVYDHFEQTGILSSVIDPTIITKPGGTVGYDYGFLLCALLETGTGNAEAVYRRTLSVTDSTGVWAEFYIKDVPYSTRYRPWESAINLEALLRYAMQ